MLQFWKMEIGGTILSKHFDHVRIITDEKGQQIDIFYTEIWKVAVNELTERQKIVFSVKIQSVDYYGLKLGKHWLDNILIPAPPPRKSSHRSKDYGTMDDTMNNLGKN